MAPLTQEETEELSARILQELQGTPYACSSLIRLTKGTTNFVFRGYLITPLHDETSTITTNSVIIKHAAEFVAVNKDFLLDVSRSVSSHRQYLAPLPGCRIDPTLIIDIGI